MTSSIIFVMLRTSFKICAFISIVMGTSAAATAEPLATGTAYEPPIARLIVGLLLCVFLAYVVIHVLRNVQQRRGELQDLSGIKFNRSRQSSNQISVLETHRLNATSDVCLLTYQGEEFLVVVGAHEPKILSKKNSFKEILDANEGGVCPE